MALTFAEMQAQVKVGLGGRSDKNDEIKTAINIAQEYVSRDFSDYEELYASPDYSVLTDTGVASTDKIISLPTNARDIKTLVIFKAENSISSFADAGGGSVTVTSSSHGLTDGAEIIIVGTANYNGSYEIGNSATNTFTITATWVATETGYWGSNESTIYELDALPKKEWERRISMSGMYSRDMPTNYFRIDTNIEVFPAPDTTYGVRRIYTLWPTTLSSDSDVTLLERKDDLIIARALAWMFSLLGDREKANHYHSMYNTMRRGAEHSTVKAGTTIRRYTEAQDTRISATPWRVPFPTHNRSRF